MADREKRGEDIQTFQYLENEKSFLDVIKSIFRSFWRAIIWWEIKNLIKNSGQSFINCFQRLSFRIKHNSNSIEHIHSNSNLCCAQMSQVETGIIFLFMKVKRFKRSFSVLSFYIVIYKIKKIRGNFFGQT